MELIIMRARKEIIARQKKQYAKARKSEKKEILNCICRATGLSRDHVARMLRKKQESSCYRNVKRRGRPPKYSDKAVIKLLEYLWVLMDCISGKRLCAGLPGLIDALKRYSELNAPEWAINKVLEMSPATADRLLAKVRRFTELCGRGTTKPGTLLKQSIPIRLGSEWEDDKPGYMEIDLVAHCGASTAGEYVNTLDMTDVYSGWTETEAVLNKAQKHVFAAIKDIRKNLPFTLRGLDSDNGSEFINAHLLRYCREENLVFTRIRPNHKNDNCHVEQKNYSIIRKQTGYSRYEGEKAVEALNRFYLLLRLYTNFFQPSMKLISKERNGSHVRKKYDTPLTPYKRLLLSEDVTQEQKASLRAQYTRLNPASLKRDMSALKEQINTMAVSFNK